MRLENTNIAGAISNLPTNRTASMSIEMNAKAFRTLSDTLYQDKIGSITRELSCNAYDAHVAAGKADVPFNIHLPSMMEPYFSVKDFGIGMSDSDIETVFCIFFKSTKDQDANAVGAFGLGAKTPFSYTDSFTVVSTKDGICRTYSLFTAADGMPSRSLLSEVPTTESNGVEIILPVNVITDRRAFAAAVSRQLHFFPVRPIIEGGDNDVSWEEEPPQCKKVTSYNGIDFYTDTNGCRGGCWIIMGPVGYELNYHILNQNIPSQQKTLEFMRQHIVRINVDMGEISVTPSRETLSYDARTLKAIEKRISGFLDKVYDDYKNAVQNLNTPIELFLYVANNQSWARSIFNMNDAIKLAEQKFKHTWSVSDFSGAWGVTGGAIRLDIDKTLQRNMCVFYQISVFDSSGSLHYGDYRNLVINNSFEGFKHTYVLAPQKLDKFKKRLQTIKEMPDNSHIFIVKVDPAPADPKVGFKDDAEFTAAEKVIFDKFKELITAFGFPTSHIKTLDQFDPAPNKKRVAVKGQGFIYNPSNNTWRKVLASETVATAGVYTSSRYSNIECANVIENLSRLHKSGLITDLPPIYAFPQKFIDKELLEDDNWISVKDYYTNTVTESSIIALNEKALAVCAVTQLARLVSNIKGVKAIEDMIKSVPILSTWFDNISNVCLHFKAKTANITATEFAFFQENFDSSESIYREVRNMFVNSFSTLALLEYNPINHWNHYNNPEMLPALIDYLNYMVTTNKFSVPSVTIQTIETVFKPKQIVYKKLEDFVEVTQNDAQMVHNDPAALPAPVELDPSVMVHAV